MFFSTLLFSIPAPQRLSSMSENHQLIMRSIFQVNPIPSLFFFASVMFSITSRFICMPDTHFTKQVWNSRPDKDEEGQQAPSRQKKKTLQREC